MTVVGLRPNARSGARANEVAILVLAGSSGWPTEPSPGVPNRSGVVELVEVTHRLHDRFEIRARVQRVEQLRGIRQQRM